MDLLGNMFWILAGIFGAYQIDKKQTIGCLGVSAFCFILLLIGSVALSLVMEAWYSLCYGLFADISEGLFFAVFVGVPLLLIGYFILRGIDFDYYSSLTRELDERRKDAFVADREKHRQAAREKLIQDKKQELLSRMEYWVPSPYELSKGWKWSKLSQYGKFLGDNYPYFTGFPTFEECVIDARNTRLFRDWIEYKDGYDGNLNRDMRMWEKSWSPPCYPEPTPYDVEYFNGLLAVNEERFENKRPRFRELCALREEAPEGYTRKDVLLYWRSHKAIEATEERCLQLHIAMPSHTIPVLNPEKAEISNQTKE